MKTYAKSELETKSLKELKQIAETLSSVPTGDARIKANWITAILNTMPVKVEAPVQSEAQSTIKMSEVLAGDTICAPSDTKHEQPLKVIEVLSNCFKVSDLKGKEFKLSAHIEAEVILVNRQQFDWSSWKIDPIKTRTVNASEDGKRKIDTSNTVEKNTPSDKKVEAEVKTCADCPLFESFDDGSGRGLCCGADQVAREHHKQTQDCLHLIEASEEAPSDTKVEEPNQYTLLPAGATPIQTAYHVRYQEQIIGMIFNVHRNNTWQCGDGFDYKYPRDAANALWKLSESPLIKTHPHKYQSPDGDLEITQMGDLGKHKLWINNKDGFYYASYRDAEKSNHPVAVRCDDVKVGDKIYVASYSRIVSNILKVPHLGINWTKFICTDGIEIKAPWYCPVQISAFPSFELEAA